MKLIFMKEDKLIRQAFSIIRKIKEIKTKNLIEVMKVGEPTINKYESGRIKLDYEKIKMFCDGLCIPIEKFEETMNFIENFNKSK